MTIFRYHYFRYTPREAERLMLRREVNNPHDPMAVLVQDANGRAVGRVPLGLSGVISESMRRGVVARSTVLYTGQMQHDGIRRGGGPKLVCVYMLELERHANLPEISRSIKQYVDESCMYL